MLTAGHDVTTPVVVHGTATLSGVQVATPFASTWATQAWTPVESTEIGHQVVGVGAAGAGDALEMRHHGTGAGRVVVSVDAGGLVQDVAARQARPEARAAGDAVAIDAVGGRAGVGPRAVDGRHRAVGDVVEEGVAHRRVAGVPVADHLVAEVAVADRVEGVGRAHQRRELLAGCLGAVVEVAEIARAVGRRLVAAGDAQDAGGRAEARPVGRVGGGAGQVDARRGRSGIRRRGERGQRVEHPAGVAAGPQREVTGHGVAADAGDRGHRAARIVEGRVGEGLRHRRRHRRGERRRGQQGDSKPLRDATLHDAPPTTHDDLLLPPVNGCVSGPSSVTGQNRRLIDTVSACVFRPPA